MDSQEQLIHRKLIEVARRSGTVYYSQVAPLVGLDMASDVDRGRLTQILDSISRSEHAAGRPLLSAVVVRKGANTPGAGFAALAHELGVHSGDEDGAFWARELGRVHQHWTSLSGGSSRK